MTSRDLLLAFKDGKLSKREVRDRLRALQNPLQRQPLSEGQQGLWALQHMEPEMSTYNLALGFRMSNEVVVARLQRACRLLLECFPILTTMFGEEDGVPFQIEQPSQPLSFEREDISRLDPRDVLPHLRARASKPFSLAQGPLMRVHLFTRATVAGVEHLLLMVVHHIIFDGASIVPMVTTLFDAYRDLAAGREPELPGSPAPYADFVSWERHMLASEAGAEHLAYWSRQLADPLPILGLPTDRPRWELGKNWADAAQSRHFEAHIVSERLSPELTRVLHAFAESQRVSLPVVFLGLFSLLLQRYTGQDEVIVGMPTIGRPQEHFDAAVGYFVNMIPIRARPASTRAFTEFLGELQLTVVDGLDHAAYPFPALVRELNLPRHAGYSPVFQVVFAYQSFLRAGGLQEILGRYRDTLAIEPLADLNRGSVYDLQLEVYEAGGGFDLNIRYRPELFDATTIERMMGHLVTLTEGVSREPNRALGAYRLLTPAEEAVLLRPRMNEANDQPTPTYMPAGACIHEVFAYQARQTPHALAVTLDTQSLTYKDLDERSTLLGLYLQQQGVTPESLVGISMGRSLEMIVGILGILKAGGAYVPLDPDYPRDRLAYMIRDSRVSLILTQSAEAAKIAALGTDARTIILDQDWDMLAEVAQAVEPQALQRQGQAEHLAYVIYTSGSTGHPKGTLVQHNHVVRLLSSTDRYFHFSATDVWTLFHSLSFDFSVWEIWGALFFGGRLVIVPYAVSRSPQEFCELLRREQVTVLNQIPSAFMQLMKVILAAGNQDHHLRYVIFGGEALSISRLKPWFERFGDTTPRLINMYGITETTVHVTYYEVGGGDADQELSLIGRPLPDLSLYILDQGGHPTPIAIVGEMHVGGLGVTRGYLNQVELTAQRFIENPFEPGTRLYKTGDLGRWLADASGRPGVLEYVGRIDEQVKVRGFRIELGEIERQLLAHPQISECVVIVKEQAADANCPAEHKQLVAFYVPHQPGAVEARQLRAQLRDSLPDYMMPAVFVEQASIPLTPSGKIDRNELSAREVASSGGETVAAPQSELEAKVLAIWKGVLNTDRIGVEDGFFDVGGDSILLVAVADRVKRELAPRLTVTDLFTYSTVRLISNHIAATTVTESSSEPALDPELNRGIATTSASLLASVAPTYLADSLAIIGISCQLPGAPNHRTFWENLRQGRAAGRFFSEAELREAGLAEALIRDPHFVPLQITIENKDCFDPAFFNISRRDAGLMDPQARLLLLHSWKVLEDAGYRPDQVPETGVFMSAGNTLYQAPWLHQPPGNPKVMASSEAYVAWMFAQGGTIPTLISHKLGLRGPSLFLHTNCSSSLVGLHAAYQSLKLNEVEVALVGAALVFPTNQLGYLHRDDLNFSSDGRCKPFDAMADGMVGGEGVAVVALKRAVDAVRDRDHIYALVRGIGVNNDGADKVGFYAPSVNGQARVIQKVLESTGIAPASIGYVEAHGTGTRLGDPIELSALKEVYQRYTDKKQFCGIGSVKSNIGHLDTAAGLAGCIKVALSLYYGEIPPSIHFERPNPAIDFANSPFYVVDRLRTWEFATPRRAALSSFGIGGTNVHAILEQYSEPADHRRTFSVPERRAVLVPLSAKNGDRLQAYARELLAFLSLLEGGSVALADLAYTFQVGRQPMPARVVFLVATRDELVRKLEAVVGGTQGLEGYFHGQVTGESSGEALQLLEDDDDREVLIRKWLGERKLDKLARLWVQGLHVDWTRLYESDPPLYQPRRISLPTYPFAQERYGWPESFDVTQVASQPVAEEKPDEATDSGICRPPSPGEGRGEGVCARSPSIPHPNPLPEGEGTKNLPRKGLDFSHLMEQAGRRGDVTGGALMADSTGSLKGPLWLLPVWNPVPAEVRRGSISPSTTDRLLVVGGNDEMQRAVREHFPRARMCHIDAADSVNDIVARFSTAAPEPIDHLLWLCSPAPDGVVGEALIDRLSQRLLPCFRTVKALLQLGYGTKDLGWTVITTGAYAVHHSESVDPSQAALHGLVGAMAGEYANWKVRLVDIRAGSPAAFPPLAELFALPTAPRGDAWACRTAGAGAATQWYRQWTIPFEPASGWETDIPPYRPGGVYVVIGGAGIIGRAWSEHVIRRVGARVIWIGRRQQDATIQAALDALAELGPAPIYITTDAANRQDLERAFQVIKQQGLEINGVVHAAVTMLSGALADLDEARLYAGLRAKVDISAHLAQLFQSEPLDFMLFFSSIVSFTTHPRQSTYAAGSLFEDALADQLARQRPGVVKSINWGYWHSSGSVTASPAALAQMAREGITPIEATEAMLALDTLLSGPMDRMVLVKATNASGLDGLNICPGERITLYPGELPSAIATKRRLIDMPTVSCDGRSSAPIEQLKSEWGVRTDDIDGLLCKLMSAQLHSMGLFTLDGPGARTSVAQLRGKLPELYGRWIEEAIAFLVEHRLLNYDRAGGAVVAGPVATSGARGIETAWREWDERKAVWLEDPSKSAMVTLVEATLRALPDILSGRQPATDVIYPNSSMTLVEATREHNRVVDYFNAMLASTVVAYVRQRQQRSALSKPGLCVIEIGAGIGGTSRAVFQKLRDAGLQDSIQEYCYTDISRAFLMHAERQYGADNPFLTYRLLNIEDPITAQGLDAGGYDVVIAANVLHATKNIRRTLHHVKAALRRGGLLLLNELSMRSLYSHLTFGLLKGWWLYEDEALRLQGSPGLSPESWQFVLEEVGFRSVFFPARELHGLGLQTIMAESDGLARWRVGDGEAPVVASPAPEVAPASRAGEAGVSVPIDPVPMANVAGVIGERLAAALKMTPDEIDPHIPFADYGLDSILAVDLVDAINRALAIDLRTTSVFDHSTVERLAGHILMHYRDAIAASPATVGDNITTEPARNPQPSPLSLRERVRVREDEPHHHHASLTKPPLGGGVDAVAIIGMAGQFPDAGDVETFWRNLVTGHDAVHPYSPRGSGSTPTSQWAGIIDERDCFDPLFFNIAPREALSMSLHQRLVLLESWKALEDAGYSPKDLAEAQAGMFIGAEPTGYFYETFTGASDALIASRLSYILNLSGPALVINTACSSSATAIHLACESLRHGESSIALAGGVAAPMDYATLVRLREVGMLSPHGRCSPFDASGDGTVLSEGVGIVVLKRLREAVVDGDHIHGVILASGMNQDGASNGITAPNGQAQECLVTSVYRRYGINPEDITYIEAHGTGTKLGDPVEANALARAFNQFTQKQHYCAVGSAKAHIGHTTAAAGVIGLIKILLSFRHRCIPGLLHFKQLNPHIDFANTPSKSTLKYWNGARKQDAPRRSTPLDTVVPTSTSSCRNTPRPCGLMIPTAPT